MTSPHPILSDLAIPARATGVVVVDLARMASNWRALAARVAPAECAAVVKADAYGLGAEQVIPALLAAGCGTFFVATAEEAEQARRLAAGAPIYVLDGVLEPQLLSAVAARPVLGDPGDVAAWAAECRRLGRTLPAAFQVDTGLNRRGVPIDDVPPLVSALGRDLAVSLIMSHLACGDDPANAMNERQRHAFEAARALFAGVPASLAASDGLMLGNAYHYDLVRPGYALFGGQAFRGGRAPVEPVVSVYVRILQVRDVPAGQSVGYSATWTTKGRRRIATLAAGYADGIFRHASGSDGKPGGLVAIAGTLCPIVGRVSMDLVTVDVTEAGDGSPQRIVPGDWAELIGPHITLEQAGAAAGTIGYEVLTRLGRRYHRTYLPHDR